MHALPHVDDPARDAQARQEARGAAEEAWRQVAGGPKGRRCGMREFLLAPLIVALMTGCATRPLVIKMETVRTVHCTTTGFERLPPDEYKCYVRCPGDDVAFWSGCLKVPTEKTTQILCVLDKEGGAE